MSQLLYLVRPWTALLRSYDDDESIKYPIRAFRTEAAAEQFASEDIPLSLNPCMTCWFDEEGIFGTGEETFKLRIDLTGEYETPEKGHKVLLNDFVNLLQSLGFTPPEEIDNETLTDWWQESEGQMSEDQKRALWRFLVPEPYQIIPVELDESDV